MAAAKAVVKAMNSFAAAVATTAAEAGLEFPTDPDSLDEVVDNLDAGDPDNLPDALHDAIFAVANKHRQSPPKPLT
jgi:hypothetical protein